MKWVRKKFNLMPEAMQVHDGRTATVPKYRSTLHALVYDDRCGPNVIKLRFTLHPPGINDQDRGIFDALLRAHAESGKLVGILIV